MLSPVWTPLFSRYQTSGPFAGVREKGEDFLLRLDIGAGFAEKNGVWFSPGRPLGLLPC